MGAKMWNMGERNHKLPYVGQNPNVAIETTMQT
jgi:hypothetical protein